MDYYIERLYDSVSNCNVLDYSVYLEKKQGAEIFNVFSPNTQLVIYITDKGCYSLVVDGAGRFGPPERGRFELSGDGKNARYKGKNFKLSRKYGKGKYLSVQDFANAIGF